MKTILLLSLLMGGCAYKNISWTDCSVPVAPRHNKTWTGSIGTLSNLELGLGANGHLYFRHREDWK